MTNLDGAALERLIASDHFRIVVGLGKSGMSLVRFLANRGTSFAVADTRENPPELVTLRRDYPHVEVRCGELDVDSSAVPTSST